MEEKWRIKDFTKWYIEKEYLFVQAAYLCYEANPYLDYPDFMEVEQRPSGTGMLNFIINSEEGAKQYGGTPRKYTGSVPLDVWDKIKERYKLLREAAKKGTLHRSFHSSENNISREDLRCFFTETLGGVEKPKFLFPEERGKSGNEPAFNHSEDFRSVSLNGENFTLTAQQAQIIEILSIAHDEKTPEIGIGLILEKIESTSNRLRDIFKSSPKARKVLIASGKKKGTYRLNL